MRKIINGKVYNTATAEELGAWSNDYYANDFRSCSETLYRTSRGAYFLLGEGGAMTRYATLSGDTRSAGRKIIAMTEGDARQWAMTYLSVDDVERIFGALEEA